MLEFQFQLHETPSRAEGVKELESNESSQTPERPGLSFRESRAALLGTRTTGLAKKSRPSIAKHTSAPRFGHRNEDKAKTEKVDRSQPEDGQVEWTNLAVQDF